MNKTNKALLGAAIAGLTGVSMLGTSAQAASKNVPCKVSSACAGKGDCGGKGHSCKGTNKCSQAKGGDGWVLLSAPDADACARAGGTVAEDKKS